jgi:hypothetical protein
MAIIGGFDVHRAGIALRAGCDVRRVFQLTVSRSWAVERAWGNLASATGDRSTVTAGHCVNGGRKVTHPRRSKSDPPKQVSRYSALRSVASASL